jgi:hypothetical protein
MVPRSGEESAPVPAGDELSHHRDLLIARAFGEADRWQACDMADPCGRTG